MKDFDNKLLQLNNLFLLSIVVMPFTTAFMSRYMFIQPFVIYCINVMLAGWLQIRMWKYVTSPKHHLHTPLPPGIRSYKITTSLIAICCFCIAMLIHWLLPSIKGILPGFFARMFLATIFIIDIFTHRHYRRKYNLSNKF